jgi:hypothetical protein
VRAGTEVRSLQVAVAVLAFVPILTGLAGILLGPSFLGVQAPWPVDLDSHFRFLSGGFLVVGLAFLSTVPGIARKTSRSRLLASLVFAGGLARLLSLGLAGAPSAGHLAGLVMELIVVPLLVLWQGRLASQPPQQAR